MRSQRAMIGVDDFREQRDAVLSRIDCRRNDSGLWLIVMRRYALADMSMPESCARRTRMGQKMPAAEASQPVRRWPSGT